MRTAGASDWWRFRPARGDWWSRRPPCPQQGEHRDRRR